MSFDPLLIDSTIINYDPGDETDWSTVPRTVQDALDELAAVPAGSADASTTTYTPAVLTDWDGDADPGNVDGALDQLAERVDDLELGGGGTLAGLTDTNIGTPVQGEVLMVDALGDWVDGFLQAGKVTYDPETPSDWPSGDPGGVKEALDALMSFLSPTLPPAAPNLDNIDFDTSEGPSGFNTWNSSFPLTGYTNRPGDAIDTNFSTSGTEHGIYADTMVDVAGTLNEDVAGTLNYAANAFNDPVSGTSIIRLKVNGSTIHSENLATFGSGNSLNGNNSGFTSLSARTSVTYDTGDPFDALKYRTGGWVVKRADLTKGYNSIQIEHQTDAATYTSELAEIIIDDATTATAYASESLHTLAMTGSKNLSGVNYHTGGTAKYNITISNAYRNTYKQSNAVSFNDVQGRLTSIASENLAASGGDEAKQHVVTNKTVTLDSGIRVLDQSIEVKTNVSRTLQSSPQSTGSSIAGLLMDDVSVSSDDDTREYFDDENKRLKSNSDFTDDTLNPNWDSSQSLKDGTAGHTDGLQVYNGRLYLPTIDFSAITNGPAGNPNYSVGMGSGDRLYYRRWLKSSGGSANFVMKLYGSGVVFIASTTAFTLATQMKVRIKLPNVTNGTGWMDAYSDFQTDQWSDDDGARDAGAGAGRALNVNWGLTVGTKNIANTNQRLWIEIIVPSNFSGYLDRIDWTFN